MPDQVKDAQKQFQDALDALADQRRQIEEDLAFTDPSNPLQWDEDLKNKRETDPGGARPCLVHDQISQYISNVAGQIDQRPPAIHAIPAGGGADKRVAEQMDGLFRHVEHVSRAQQHYVRAVTSAARVGVGYLIVRPEFVDRAMGYQEPRIGSEPDPMKVVFDPWSQDLDGADANMGWLLTPLSHKQFERQFGEKADKVSFSDEERKLVHDERESIIVADQWLVDDKQVVVIVFTGQDGEETSLPEDEYLQACENAGTKLHITRQYKDKVRRVMWCRMSGAEILVNPMGEAKAIEFPADSIGIVPVYGYVGFSSGRMKFCGMGRRAMEPQKAYNYHISEVRAYMNAAPKAPWVASRRAVAGLEALWDRASVEQRAWLPFNDVDAEGPIGPPMRPQLSVDLRNHQQAADQALRDIQSSLGMYQANLGAPSNETSGVAIDARKEQGESSTAHFPSHLSASVAQVGRICVDMLPRLIDTRRQMRILGIDQTPGTVVIDPKAPEAMQETPQGIVINPKIGAYDIRVVIGSPFATQRSQAQAAYTEMMRASPQLMPAIAPLWAQTLDVPNADKLAQVLTAMAPDPVKAILQPQDGQPTTAQLMAERDQLKAGLQEAIQHAQQAQQEADQASQELQQAQQETQQAKMAADSAKQQAQQIKQTKLNEAEQQEEAAELEVAKLELDWFAKQTDRIKVVGAAMTPEEVKALALKTAQDALAQQAPQIDDNEQTEGAMSEPNPQIGELSAGQEQITTLLETLIQLVQHPRERIPVRGKDGSIQRVIDRMAIQPPPEMEQ